MDKNRRIALAVNDRGREYLEDLAAKHQVGISDVIRTALELAADQPARFEEALSKKRRFS